MQIIRAVQEFLEPQRILDGRRKAIHERLADGIGHLKRYLAELVRRFGHRQAVVLSPSDLR